MAFWNRKPETHSNAPSHWPKVELGQFDNAALNLLTIGGALSPMLNPPKVSMAFMESFVYEDGILQAPLVITEDGHKTCVFVYGKQDRDAAAQYSAMRAILKARESAAAVYYGPEALTPVQPAKVLKPIDTPMFSKAEKPSDNARYSLWWATPDDPSFSASEDRALLDRWFEAIDGYGYLLFSAFVNDLDLVDPKQPAYGLPSQAFLQALSGPGSTDVMLYASEEDGFFLAFDEGTTSAKRRRIMLRLLTDFVGPYRAEIVKHKIPARTQERGLATWQRVRDEALAKESRGETGIGLHSVIVTNGQPVRSPHATSDRERQDQPAVPGREVLDFGMDLVTLVVARLQSKTIVQSSQEQLAGPNVFPIMAVKAGGHVYERSMPYEDPPVATAAAGRVLDEWPDAEMVAVLVDAAIRESGQRVDILGVQVQQVGNPASASLIQRYKTSDTGAIELVGRPTAMTGDPFVLPASSPPPGAPGAPGDDLMAIASKALARISQVEAHGRGHADADEPLGSPEALIDDGDEMCTTVFAMQGPLTAAGSLLRVLDDPRHAAAQWVVYWFDDLVYMDGVRDTRLRLCVSRRGDPSTAIIDQGYEGVETPGGFRLKGAPAFKRWGGPLLS